MFDIWLGEINLTVLAILVSVAVVFPIQLLLCFKARSLALRLLPVILSALCAVAMLILYAAFHDPMGWGSLVFLFGAIYAAFALLLCGIAWGVRGIVRKKNKH